MKIKKMIPIILIILSIFSLNGCGSQSNLNDNLKAKVTEEINYLDNKIITILNSINGIYLENYKIETKEISSEELQKQEGAQKSSSNDNQPENSSSNDDDQNNNEEPIIISEMKTTSVLENKNNIDWNNIKFEIELLHNTWATITVDLYKLNIPGDIINEFSGTLNTVTLGIKNEDILKSTETLALLYSYLPRYLMYATNKKEEINIKDTKTYILTALYNVIVNNWNNVSNNINYAIESYTPVINNLEYTKGKEHTSNRIYIILNELKNSVVTNDKDIFFIKYKNIMNELNII